MAKRMSEDSRTEWQKICLVGMPYLFVAALFACFACNNLLTRGMFMDGLIYTTCAANLASGQGDLWHLSFTPTQLSQFYEHPPLMIWMLAAWFRFFGTSMVAAKAYSVAILLLAALLMVAIWRRLGYGTANGWLPLLMLTLIPDVPLGIHNNYLESTMAVFILFAVWCELKADNTLLHLTAGFATAAAFLVKGPTGLFPLVLPLLLYAFGVRKYSLWRMAAATFTMLIGLLMPLAALYCLNPDAHDYLTRYAERQIIGGMHEPVTSRIYVLTVFLSRAAIPLVCSVALLLGAFLRKGASWCPTSRHLQVACMLLTLALCGSMPMMLSTKQRAFYLLTIYPIVALSAAVLAEPLIRAGNSLLHGRKAATATAFVFAAAIALNALHYGRPGRDAQLLTDMDIIAPHLAPEETLAIPHSLADNFSLHGYYYFYHRHALDAEAPHAHLLTAQAPADSLHYRQIPLATAQYRLYERCD